MKHNLVFLFLRRFKHIHTASGMYYNTNCCHDFQNQPDIKSNYKLPLFCEYLRRSFLLNHLVPKLSSLSLIDSFQFLTLNNGVLI